MMYKVTFFNASLKIEILFASKIFNFSLLKLSSQLIISIIAFKRNISFAFERSIFSLNFSLFLFSFFVICNLQFLFSFYIFIYIILFMYIYSPTFFFTYFHILKELALK